MPEGPEVRHIVEKIRYRLNGKWLLFLQWMPYTKYSESLARFWEIHQKCFPAKCSDILCKGKQIFIFLNNGICIQSSLGMEGHWYYFDNPDSQNEYLFSSNHRKFCLHFGNYTPEYFLDISLVQLWYDDMLSYGNITFTDYSTAISKMENIGPDLLATVHPFTNIENEINKVLPTGFSEKIDLNRFAQEIKNPRRCNMLICIFQLKHQEYLSGIGNYLKSEILYASRIHPNRRLGSLDDDEINRLYLNTLSIISRSYICGGLTHGTFLDPDRKKGEFIVEVYKREGQTDKNGFIIKKLKTKDGRSTFIVDELQRL